MTSYAIEGFSLRERDSGDIVAPALFEVVLPDGIDGFLYTLSGLVGDLPVFDVDFGNGDRTIGAAYDVRLDGVSLPASRVDTQNVFFQINDGPYAGTVLFDLYQPDRDAHAIFQIGGPPLDLGSPEAFAAAAAYFEDVELTDVGGLPSGAFAPGTLVPFAGVSGVTASEDDIVAGTRAGDVFDTGVGNDSISGNNGADTLFGSVGQDTVSGGGGNDQVFGNKGADSVFGGGGADLVVGGGAGDELSGGRGSDTLRGVAGNDLLLGGAGVDDLEGNAGSDTLFGGGQGDLLSGGAGRDTLGGEGGDDTLTGGAANDVFLLARGDGEDVITDFRNNRDTLELNANLLAEAMTGRQVVNRLGEQEGDDVVLRFDRGESVTILDITLAELRNDVDVA